jgi:glycosyltransferase involved in cell wall biosynthesis
MVADVEGLQKEAANVTDEQISAVVARHQLKGVVFLYVGRLIRLKGLAELLKAWRELTAASQLRDATLLIVGDGPERGRLQSHCRECDLGNVRFVGNVDYDALAPYYRCADVFVIPTLEDNWSLVVPEAMACGLPIVCSKYNGCWPELVTPANGWVFDPLSQPNMVRVLREVCVSKTRLRQMGQRSRRIVSTHTARRAAQSIYTACQWACQAKILPRVDVAGDALSYEGMKDDASATG